jgi:trehalose synthase
MLPEVNRTPAVKLDKYRGIITDKLFEEIVDLAKNFKGLNVAHINATPRGGGIAELLKSLVPLMKGVGLKAKWYNNPPGERFFYKTKHIHNSLQGERFKFPFSARKLYIRHMETTGKLMQDMKSDIWIIHDPQPVGLISYMPNFHPSIWRVHIDTSHPNKEAWEFIYPFMMMYDRIVFTSKDFVGPLLPRKKVRIFPPAIDPLTIKNSPLDLKNAKNILKSLGINSQKPLVVQVARFDPWKDPLGVIAAYKIAKKRIPNLQLALLGLFLARDDPEALKVFREVKRKVKNDPDVFLFSDPAQIGSLKVDVFVNAFQTAATVVLHKSVREGFGLSVSEAMWKGKAVIGGNVGGIKLQIRDGKNGFLVSSPKEAAKRIVQLIKNPQLAKKLGKAAKKTVREKFLMPRLLRDYLKLFKELV